MVFKIFRSLLIAGLFLSISNSSNAQTIKISSGSDSNGTRSYVEVFEYDYVSQKPSFPGGESKLVEFINSEREYPREAYERGIQGRVTCSFIVNTDGSISNVRLLRGVNVLLNEEAIRIFNAMPSWIPGRNAGRAVPVRVTRTVNFRR